MFSWHKTLSDTVSNTQNDKVNTTTLNDIAGSTHELFDIVISLTMYDTPLSRSNVFQLTAAC
jgi:hypothetical protein